MKPRGPAVQCLDVLAADGTPLAVSCRPAQRGSGTAVLIVPGFWRQAESQRLAALADDLCGRHDVLSLDVRGHGRSGGRFTFGVREHLDVEALLALAARRGARRVAVIGLSLGGSALITALGRADAPPRPVDVRAAVVLSAPACFRRVRPRPWRGGGRDVAWSDVLSVPRIDWRFPLTAKSAPEDCIGNVRGVPLRILHGCRDWLVDHEHALRLQERRTDGGELFLLDLPGALHADELLGAGRALVLRLIQPFIDAALEECVPAVPGAGEALAADPWLAGLRAHVLREAGEWSRDLGDVGPDGPLGEVLAVCAGRDGAHLACRAGERAYWARGLRDGSVHGLNLLATALAVEGSAWDARVRTALAGALGTLEGPDVNARRPAGRHVVTRRGVAGISVT